ncbi:MAG: COG1470 family protein [Candidatus Aquicultorales bacterium]
MTKPTKLILVSLIVVALLPHAETRAQEGTSLGVAPSLIAINVDERRDSYQYPLSVFNDGSAPIKVNVGFYDFSMDTKGKVSFASGGPNSKSWSAATWLSFPKEEITLQPGEEKTLSLIIKPPRDAEPGSHRALVAFGTASDTANKGQVPIRAAVSTLVLISVEGKTVLKPLIDLNLPRIVFTDPSVDVTLSNAGNAHFFAEGYVAFLDRDDKPVSKKSIKTPRQGALVLPDAKRSFTVEWEEAPYFGFHEVEARVSITGGNELVKRQDFFIVRWQVLLAVASFIGLCLIAYRLLTRYKVVLRADADDTELPSNSCS